jgi:hypothetical protein
VGTEAGRGSTMQIGRHAATILATAALALIVVLVVGRTIAHLEIPGHPEVPRYGMQDFRDSIYYPVRTLLDGANPYSPAAVRQRFATGSVFPLYTPIHFAVHWPYGFMTQRTAEAVHLIAAVGFTLALAVACILLCDVRPALATVFGLAAVLFASRPGYMNVFQGQTAAYLVLATYGALRFGRSRPGLAAACFALTCLKPTFGLPLGVLLVGLGALAVSGVIGTRLVQSAGGWDAFLESLRENVGGWHGLQEARGATGILSIDTIALIDRVHDVSPLTELVIGIVILSIGVAAVAYASRSATTSPLLVECTAAVTMLTFAHHQYYDVLLLALPLTALASRRLVLPDDPHGGRRIVLLALLAIAFFNHAASYTVLDGLGIAGAGRTLIVNTTAAAITVTFVVLVWAAFRRAPVALRAKSLPH